jgi:putative flippase GtrA
MKDSCGSVRGVVARARVGRLARFATVGASGIAVNLAVLHLFAGVLRAPEVVASALAIEASILTNFLLNDAYTFADRRRGTRRLERLARYHAVSAVGIALQLGTFAALALLAARALGRGELGALRYPAQLAGIALGFVWNYSASMRFAWGGPGTPAPHAVADADARARALPKALFLALLVLHVLPIWLVAYFPTQDGPLHVENVLALLRHDGSPLLQRWYLANWGPQPNWLTQGLLAAFLVLASPVVAEKLVLTLYTLLFPLAFRTLMPRGTRGWWGALAAFPFVHAYPFHMGFWNFCYGVALALLAAGFWLRTRGRLTPPRWAALAGLSILLFAAHSVAFAGAVIAVGSLLAFRAALAYRRAAGNPDRRRTVLRGYARRAAAGALAVAPGLVLLGVWLLAHRDRVASRIPLAELAPKLVTGYALVSIDRREIPLAIAVMLVLFVAVVHLLLTRAGQPRRVRPNDGWLVAALAFATLYFAVPDVVAAGAHVSDRLALFSFLSVAAWIGAGAVPRASLRRTALALAAIAVAALGTRFHKQRELSGLLEEFVSAKAAVPRDRVLLPLALTPHGPRDANGRRLGYRIKPFLHAAGWIVAERGGVDLKNSQANTDHCPVRFPDDRNPFRTIATSLGRMEGVPPCVDLRRAPRIAEVDYVLVWGATREVLDTPCGAALAADLAGAYEPVFLSAPRGMLEVWQPRERTRTARR